MALRTIDKTPIPDTPNWREAVYAYQRTQQPTRFIAKVAHNFVPNVSRVHMANPDDPKERKLIDMTLDACDFHGITNVPYVMIADTPVLNAASIMGKAFVFTTGIMEHMREGALRAVVGHEMGHHRHSGRDQAVLAGTLLATLGTGHLLNNKINSGISWVMGKTHRALQWPALIASYCALIAAYNLPFTPWRWHMELESDRDGAAFAGAGNMADALQTLKDHHRKPKPPEKEQSLFDTCWKYTKKAFMFLTMPLGSHPPIDGRVAEMRALQMREPFKELPTLAPLYAAGAPAKPVPNSRIHTDVSEHTSPEAAHAALPTLH